MARSLSDIAAMAGEPVAAVATVAATRGMDPAQMKAIYAGLRRAGDAFGCAVIGGDVAAWDHPLLLTVTMFGRPAGEAPVLRSGAQVGDAICVTGELGASLASGKHLRFTPRIAEARELISRAQLHAMIDISDGLAADLGHLCRESGIGAELDGGAIPLSSAARRSRDPLAAALGDGEDYELLFTLANEDAEPLVKNPPPGVAVSRIGRMTSGDSVTLIGLDGEARPIGEPGYRHRT